MQKHNSPTSMLTLILLLTGISLWGCTPSNDAALLADQPVAAYWQITPDNEEGWTVGDRIPFTLHIVYEISITPPESSISPADDLSEVVNQTSTKPQRGRGTRRIETLVETVYWTPGEHTSPSAVISFSGPDGQPQTMLVKPISIQIKSVLTEEDPQKKDLKPQASLPRPPIWGWVLAAVLAAGLLYGFTRWLLQRRQRAPLNEMENALQFDTRTPAEIALAELSRIESLHLPAQSEFKTHYTLVSDCIRGYFEALYKIPALDRTTNEFLYTINQARIEPAIIQSVASLLNEADLVKFAKAIPTVNAARQLIHQARSLIEKTRPPRLPEKEANRQ